MQSVNDTFDSDLFFDIIDWFITLWMIILPQLNPYPGHVDTSCLSTANTYLIRIWFERVEFPSFPIILNQFLQERNDGPRSGK